jgi:succinoglycan biosynthesis transport protein ExoP
MEGKSVMSKNFASILAKLNAKTLLIDADLRGPKLTRELAPSAAGGLIEAVIGTGKLEDLVLREERSGLHFLPAVSGSRVPHTSELLASLGLRSLLNEAQQTYDYIIIDLPPFGPVADVRAISPQMQAFAYVLEWRKTPRRIARDMLDNYEDVRRKCLGVILNKVDVKRIELFEDRGSRYYYYKRYTKSYYLDHH